MRRRDLLAAVLVALGSCTGYAEKRPPAKPVNINTATAEELTALPGIGPATARAIVRCRQKNGPFRKVEELLIVRGISRARLRVLRPYVRVK